MVQSWPAEYSQLFIMRFEIKNSRPGNKIHLLSKSDPKKFRSSTKKVTSFLLFIYIEKKKKKNGHVNNKQINKQRIKVNRWKQLFTDMLSCNCSLFFYQNLWKMLVMKFSYSLQPAFLLKTNSHGYFLRIHVFLFSTFLWCDCDLESTSFSKITVSSCFEIERRQWIYKILFDSNAWLYFFF